MGAFVVAWLSLLAGWASAQDSRVRETNLSLEMAMPSDRPMRADERLAIRVRTEPGSPIERLAVVIGDTDWTGLFAFRDGWIEYQPGPVQWPVGKTPLTVFAVMPGNVWLEIQSSTLHVVTPLGFERAAAKPKISVTSQGQAAELHAPDSHAPARGQFQDVSSVLGFETEHVRGSMSVLTHVNVLAVSSRPLAVRFAERADRAPLADLTDFAVKVRSPARDVTVGQGSVAINRYLMPALSSRGFTYTERRSRLDMMLGAASARSVVGFQRVLGMTDAANRVAYGRVGAELSRRPGALRIEVAMVGGSRPARSGFNQADIGDVDRSRGYSTRFSGDWLHSRIRIDSGIATVAVSSPADPLLSQGISLVSSSDRTSRARHVEIGTDLVRRVSRSSGQLASVSTSYRFERVDPFFRSVGSPQGARGDLHEQAADFTVNIGGISGQVSRTWGHDNLERIPSILTTDSELIAARAGTPTGGWRQGRQHVWWPGVTYQWTMSSQVGRGLPTDGGFANASQVPDQHNDQHSIRAEWRAGKVGFAYSLNRSFQDNRQDGRHTADFLTLAHQATVRLALSGLDASFDVSRDRSNALEFADVTRNTRLAGTVNWRVTSAHGVGAIGSWSGGSGTTLGTSSASAIEARYTYTLPLGIASVRRTQMQMFARSAWRWNAALSMFLAGPVERRSWSLNTGLSFSFS